MREVNWHDLADVIAFAKQLGYGFTVYQHPDHKRYHVVSSKQVRDLAPGCRCIYHTPRLWKSKEEKEKD